MSDDVLDRVRKAVSDALYADLDDVSADSNLVKDLGAESIDFLDIVFRLEKEFDVKIRRGALEKKARGDLSEDEFAVEGRLLEKGADRLRQLMPEIEQSQIKAGLYLRELPALFTVATFERMVREAVAEKKGLAGASAAMPAPDQTL